MEQKTEASQAVDKLLPCAFCGSFAVLKEIGNDHTKTRSVQVKCANFECRVERTDKAMARGMEWLRAVAIENWNRRPALKAQPAPTEAAQGDRHALQAEGKHPAPCARHCEATAFGIEIRRLTAENAKLRAAQGEDSARLEFLMQREAWIAWSKDGESCRVFHRDDEGENGPMMGWVPEAWSHDPREAIDRARASAETGGVKP